MAAVLGEKVAETSGFATDLPQSAYLAHTIRRAISAAQQRSHRYVTLEHLLLALLDDPDALALLEGARADLAGLRGAATETVNHNLATLYTPGEFDLRASYKVERVLQSASDDARRMGLSEVDGAFVAVALFHETDSPAYDLLKRHNFVFHAANGWLDRNRGSRARSAASPVEEDSAALASATVEPVIEQVEDDTEILLDEIVDDAAPAENERSAGGSPDAEIAAQGDREDTIEPVRWPVMRPGPRIQPSPADSNPVWSRAGSPLRPVTARSAELDRRLREEPGLDTVTPSQSSEWEIGPAVRRPAVDRADLDRDLRNAEPASISVTEKARTEPRLPSAQPESGLGTLIPGRGRGGQAGEIEPRFEPPAAAADQDLGAAVPARDQQSASRQTEPADGRPLRPHASARERSATASRPVLTTPAQKEAERPMANGAARGSGPAERRAPQAGSMPAPAPAAPRAEAPLPPAGRLDDMRVRPGSTPPAAKPPGKKPAAPREKDGERPSRARRRQQSAGAVYIGKLAENIPRKMRAFKASPVEVRVSREETEAFLAGFEGSGDIVRHNITVTQAMSVMLRAPDGGFTIETLGPETQWIFKRPGDAEKEAFGRWRWSVTPKETGRRRLQLVVAARSVDENGLFGDTALPEQVITVQVRANYLRSFGRAVKWVMLMAIGGAITEGTLQLLRLFGG